MSDEKDFDSAGGSSAGVSQDAVSKSLQDAVSESGEAGSDGGALTDLSTQADPNAGVLAPEEQPESAPTPVDPAVRKRRRRNLIIGGVVAVALVLGGGIGVYAYVAARQQTQLAVLEALITSSEAKDMSYTGTVKFDTGGIDAVVTLTGERNGLDGSADANLTLSGGAGLNVSLKGSVITTGSGDIYFKLKGLESAAELYQTFGGLQGGAVDSSAIGAFVQEFDGKWVKITKADLPSASSASSSQNALTACVQGISQRVKNDSSYRSELAGIYGQHSFVTVDQNLGSKDGQLGYTVTVDDSEAAGFVQGIAGSKLFQSVSGCKSSLSSFDTIDPTIFANLPVSGSTKLWIDQTSHRVSHIVTTVKVSPTSEETLKVDASASVDMSLTYGHGSPAAAPSNALSFTELQNAFKRLVPTAPSGTSA